MFRIGRGRRLEFEMEVQVFQFRRQVVAREDPDAGIGVARFVPQRGHVQRAPGHGRRRTGRRHGRDRCGLTEAAALGRRLRHRAGVERVVAIERQPMAATRGHSSFWPPVIVIISRAVSSNERASLRAE